MGSTDPAMLVPIDSDQPVRALAHRVRRLRVAAFLTRTALPGAQVSAATPSPAWRPAGPLSGDRA
jgi:hypothetical protein